MLNKLRLADWFYFPWLNCVLTTLSLTVAVCLSLLMSWQKSGLCRTARSAVPETGSKLIIRDPHALIEEDAQVDGQTARETGISEQKEDIPKEVLDTVLEDDAPSFPFTLWPDRTLPQNITKADISSESEPSVQRVAEAASPFDIEQLEQRYVDLQTQVARLYCLWISDLPPDNRRMRLQEAIETARAHVELGRETIISAEQRPEHWKI